MQAFYPPVASASQASKPFNPRDIGKLLAAQPATGARPASGTTRNTIQCYLACAVLFIFYSRFFDVYLTQYRIPAITLGLASLASLFSGHLVQSLQYRVS